MRGAVNPDMRTNITTGLYRRRREADVAARALLASGVTREQIGLLMSEMTQSREFGWVRNAGQEILAPLAAGAVLVQTLGMVAAGALLEDFSGLPLTNLTDAIRRLGIDAEEAERLAEGVRNGGIAVITRAEVEDELDAAPAEVRAEGSSPTAAPVEAEVNSDGVVEAFEDEAPTDPTVIRFSLLELD